MQWRVTKEPQIKKGPLAGPCVHKVEDSRRRLSLKGGKRRLRTSPLKRSRATITSKLAINFVVDMQKAHVTSPPFARKIAQMGVLNGLQTLQRSAIDLQPACSFRSQCQEPAVRRGKAQSARGRPAQARLPQAQSQRRRAHA